MIFDEAGRPIAPPQNWPDPRPQGPWDANGPYATFAFNQSDYEGWHLSRLHRPWRPTRQVVRHRRDAQRARDQDPIGADE